LYLYIILISSIYEYIQGESRKQLVLFPDFLDNIINHNNEVRLIDLFVDSLDLEKLGFEVNASDDGRPE